MEFITYGIIGLTLIISLIYEQLWEVRYLSQRKFISPLIIMFGLLQILELQNMLGQQINNPINSLEEIFGQIPSQSHHVMTYSFVMNSAMMIIMPSMHNIIPEFSLIIGIWFYNYYELQFDQTNSEKLINSNHVMFKPEFTVYSQNITFQILTQSYLFTCLAIRSFESEYQHQKDSQLSYLKNKWFELIENVDKFAIDDLNKNYQSVLGDDTVVASVIETSYIKKDRTILQVVMAIGAAIILNYLNESGIYKLQ